MLNILEIDLDDDEQCARLKSPRTLEAMRNLGYTIGDIKPIPAKILYSYPVFRERGMTADEIDKVNESQKIHVQEKKKKIIKEREKIIQREKMPPVEKKVDEAWEAEEKRRKKEKERIDELVLKDLKTE